jgi:hypothetical protein
MYSNNLEKNINKMDLYVYNVRDWYFCKGEKHEYHVNFGYPRE